MNNVLLTGNVIRLRRMVRPLLRRLTAIVIGIFAATDSAKTDLHIASTFRSPRQLILVCCLLAIVLIGSSNAFAQKKILIVSSYDIRSPAVIIYYDTIRQKFKDNGKRVQFYTESLDDVRIPQAAYEGDFVRLLSKKYAAENLDCIFVFGTPALKLFLAHETELLANVPRVFMIIDDRTLAGIDLGTNTTGVSGRLQFGPTLEIILGQNPNTRTIALITGQAPLDKSILDAAKNELPPYEGRVKLQYLSDQTIPELRQQLAAMPPDTIAYLLSYSADREGNAYVYPETASLIEPFTRVPLYGSVDTGMGAGIVGGNLLSFEAQAEAGADIVLRIMAGDRPADIPPITAPNVTMFDWRQLRRWNIDENQLPAGSILRFREPTFWEEYRPYVAGGVALFILQSMLITWLLVTRSRRRIAESERNEFQIIAAAEHHRLDEIVANTPGVVWESEIIPETGMRRLVFISDYIKKMLGYSAEEVLATPALARSIVAEEDIPKVDREIASLVATGKGRTVQSRWRAKDGHLVWVESQYVPVRDAAGKITGLRGVALDVTDRKLAGEELHAREFELREAQRIAQTGSWDWDPETDKVKWSEELYRIARLDRSLPAPGLKEHVNFYTPESFALLTSTVAESMNSGAPYELELEMVRTDKSRIWTRARGEVLYNGKGKVIKLRGTLQDITDLKNTEEALRQSETRFRNMADAAPVLVWVAGTDKLFTYFNKGWLEFTGRALEQELGNGWTEGVYSEDYDHCVEIYNAAFERREQFEMEYRLRRADGVYRWIYDIGSPRFSINGEFLGYIGSCIDITGRKEADETLRDLSGKLINAQEEERSRVARELHDDLSQSLALLSIQLNALSRNTDDPGTLKKEVDQLTTQIQRLSSDVHRISHELHPAKLEQLGLESALRGFCREISEAHGIKVNVEAKNVPRSLPNDISLCLYRIIQESLQNIVKHSGAIYANVKIDQDGDEIRLEVSDKGSGFNLEAVRSKESIGLISMNERIRSVNGAIIVDSKVGAGTQIIVRIPIPSDKTYTTVRASY